MNPYRYDIQTLERKARAVRRHIVRLNANSPAGGHTGADLSQVELLTALYFRVLNVAPDRLDDPQRDIYIQSKGHAVGCYYCVLAEAGFFPVEWLETYQHANSHLPGHPVRQKTPGIELNTGALGHGLPVAVGLALAAKKSNSTRRIFLITGDGELAEGSVWEGTMAAAHYGLDNLCAVVDRNRLQISGSTEDIMHHDDLEQRFSSFGWHVVTADGNDIPSLDGAFEEARSQKGRPTVVIANTTKGCGVSFMENQAGWHHRVPTADRELEERVKHAHGSEEVEPTYE